MYSVYRSHRSPWAARPSDGSSEGNQQHHVQRFGPPHGSASTDIRGGSSLVLVGVSHRRIRPGPQRDDELSAPDPRDRPGHQHRDHRPATRRERGRRSRQLSSDRRLHRPDRTPAELCDRHHGLHVARLRVRGDHVGVGAVRPSDRGRLRPAPCLGGVTIVRLRFARGRRSRPRHRPPQLRGHRERKSSLRSSSGSALKPLARARRSSCSRATARCSW